MEASVLGLRLATPLREHVSHPFGAHTVYRVGNRVVRTQLAHAPRSQSDIQAFAFGQNINAVVVSGPSITGAFLSNLATRDLDSL